MRQLVTKSYKWAVQAIDVLLNVQRTVCRTGEHVAIRLSEETAANDGGKEWSYIVMPCVANGTKMESAQGQYTPQDTQRCTSGRIGTDGNSVMTSRMKRRKNHEQNRTMEGN